MRIILSVLYLMSFLNLAVLAQSTDPVPLINQPLSPATAAPGGGNFTVTVNGTGFVASSVVNWNGTAKPTTFVSSSQLVAAIAASDIAVPATVGITVLNATSGSTPSNVVFFAITDPTPSVTFTRSDLVTSAGPFSVAVADLTASGKLSLAVANYVANTISVLLGNGDGTFATAVDYPTGN